MSHPRIEEIPDSDDEVSDPSEGDIDDFVEQDILMRKPTATSSSSSKAAAIPPAGVKSHIISPSSIPTTTATDNSAYSGFQVLYPVYFDAARSRAEGRRVPASLAVRNPLARELANACSRLRLETLFEPGKTHPKDWANPGRVRVGLKRNPLFGQERWVRNKHHLLILVAQHLREHPTTEASEALHVRVQGAPLPDTEAVDEKTGQKKGWPKPAVPRGWKMGELLPHYSPGLTGGGVSENMFRDMMKEMQQAGAPGGGPGGIGDMAAMLQGLAGPSGMGGTDSGSEAGGGGGKKKKDKKKK